MGYGPTGGLIYDQRDPMTVTVASPLIKFTPAMGKNYSIRLWHDGPALYWRVQDD